jgi:Protein of unknown function (DUF1559)
VWEAVRKPTFYIPLLRKSEDDLLLGYDGREVACTRSFARALSARANHRIAIGDINGAIDDIVACKRLGRHVGHCGSLVAILVGLAIEGIADEIGVCGSLEHPPTTEQLRRLIDEYGNLPPRAEYNQGVLFERYVALDFVQGMARRSEAVEEWGWSTSVENVLGVNWNAFAERVNEHYDTLVNTGWYTPFSFDPMSIISHRARSEFLADYLASRVLSTCQASLEATRISTCAERIRQIVLAMHLYERDHGTLPPACTIDADGTPLHSWRVVLLPYLGHKNLHDKIRLDEPWDSEHNRQFHQQDITFYQCPSATLAPYVRFYQCPELDQLPPGLATYSVVVGPEMPFEAGIGKSLSDFGPNRSNMILVVERQEPVCWMDPTGNSSQAAADKGIHPHPDERTDDGIGSKHPGQCRIGHCSGAARFISETVDTELFQELLRGTADRLP